MTKLAFCSFKAGFFCLKNLVLIFVKLIAQIVVASKHLHTATFNNSCLKERFFKFSNHVILAPVCCIVACVNDVIQISLFLPIYLVYILWQCAFLISSTNKITLPTLQSPVNTFIFASGNRILFYPVHMRTVRSVFSSGT